MHGYFESVWQETNEQPPATPMGTTEEIQEVQPC